MKRNYISHSNSFVSVPLNYIACRLTIRVEDNLSLLPYLMYLSIPITKSRTNKNYKGVTHAKFFHLDSPQFHYAPDYSASSSPAWSQISCVYRVLLSLAFLQYLLEFNFLFERASHIVIFLPSLHVSQAFFVIQEAPYYNARRNLHSLILQLQYIVNIKIICNERIEISYLKP